MDDFFDKDFDQDDDAAEGMPVTASRTEITPVPYTCAFCGEQNETMLDISGGDYRQRYTEDCTVCCRPNLISLAVDRDSMQVEIQNEPEYDS